ncbi:MULTISPECIES: transposase [Flavobacterium]|uniref:Transposase n=1 Tax=Flavobacterium jumunjinense TaxID=998845 RepID=A0ABV5GK03_9FLAO|nr:MULTISPECIES: transposase [Flavobacterium]
MAEKYQKKYSISTARLKNWDYGSCASYFITICTANRDPFFGEIIDGKMNLSVLGTIVAQEWIKTIEIRPDMHLELGEFVVMPNHFHGIIFIGNNAFNRRDAMHGVSKTNDDSKIISNTMHDAIDTHHKDAMHGVSKTNTMRDAIDTHQRDAMHGVSTDTENTFGPQTKNLASIVRGFKSAVTTWARKNNIPFEWQSRFHDHIIRNATVYNRISNYIINNPAKWQEDKFFAS